jgi:hypothetical protein
LENKRVEQVLPGSGGQRAVIEGDGRMGRRGVGGWWGSVTNNVYICKLM